MKTRIIRNYFFTFASHLHLLFTFSLFPAFAEKVTVDNRFILDGERQMRSWTFNTPESFKPYGEVHEAMLEGMPGVRLVSAGKQTQIYMSVSMPVKAGEKYRVSAKARGEGTCSIGFFAHGPKWEWRGDQSKRFSPSTGLDGEPQEVSFVFTVPDDVAGLRPQLCCYSGAKAEFFDLQVEKLGE